MQLSCIRENKILIALAVFMFILLDHYTTLSDISKSLGIKLYFINSEANLDP